ncbi:hypothetical protein ACGFNU_38375 [Spirillospora sp. NPDC048911]|uniref:hypothetical protein n=1 Tax=Spirillospora sp. NPDC048911 TaxID=3364527 RepID=UPI0037181C49
MPDRFKIEYRPAADLHDHYRTMESKMWNHILVFLVIVGAIVLVANLAAGFINERGTIFLLAVEILGLIVLMLNQTWTRLDKLAHDQDKVLAMLLAITNQPLQPGGPPEPVADPPRSQAGS